MNSDTLIIIIIGAVLGLLVFVFALSKAYRAVSATSNPLPPVQPLAHHRHSYYQLHVLNGSKTSLLDDEYLLVDPQPLFHPRAPSLSSSPPAPRPSSVASSSRLSPSPSLAPSSGRRGLPHSPHSQFHVVLPAPLSTSEFGQLNQSPTPRRPRSYPRPTSRHFLDVSSEHDRRSMSFVDRWLPTPSTDSYTLAIDTSIPAPSHRRAPSPLIPSSSSSTLPRSLAPTLPNSSANPSDINIALDPGAVSTSSYSSTSVNTPDSFNPVPIPTAVTADIPIPVPPLEV